MTFASHSPLFSFGRVNGIRGIIACAQRLGRREAGLGTRLGLCVREVSSFLGPGGKVLHNYTN